jgi:acetolactate synthase-1/2/3 large subunit
MRELTGGQALVAQLIEEGVTDVFGIPGVQLDWAVDALREARDQIRFTVPRHEQATSYMADGYARTTGREGVCMVVPGPGMLNALAGLATAYACNSPVLCIVGQIPSPLIDKKLGILHEIPDQSGVLRSLTKWHGIAHRVEDVPALVHEAFIQLRSGRPRPVAIEIPPDVLEAAAQVETLPRAERAPLDPDGKAIADAALLLKGARFPVIQAGGGVVAADAGPALVALAERLQAPVVMSEGGRGALDDRHPLALTSLGGRAVFPHADVILVIGSRFVDGHGAPTHAADGVRYIYLNVEPRDCSAPRRAGVAIHADAKTGIEAIVVALSDIEARPSATARIALAKAWAGTQLDAIRPQRDFVGALRASMADDDILVSELTQVGFFANIAFPIQGRRSYLTPGYQGTLGYGFDTAIGAAIGNPGRRVISLNGDGGFGWGIQELATVARDRPDLSIVVFVDGRFGNVQRIQKRVFGIEFATEVASPDFALLAQAYDIPGAVIEGAEALEHELKAAAARGGPALIAVKVGQMPSPWALIHPFVPSPAPPPPNPLGDPLGAV